MARRCNVWIFRIAALVWLALLFLWPAVGLSILGLWGAYVMLAACYYQAYLARSLERALGFRLGKQYLLVGRWRHCGVAIRWIAADGAFARAGFQEDDVLPGVSFTDFFRRLHSHRGQIVELAVVDGGEGPPFEERPQRVVGIAVPSSDESPPTREDAVVAFAIVYPYAFGAIGFAVGCLAFVWPAVADMPLLQMATPFAAGSLGMLLGFGLWNLSSSDDHHNDVLMPHRG